MPLVWAHAEHVKLLRSLAEHAAGTLGHGRVFDTPRAAASRYGGRTRRASVLSWRAGFEPDALPQGRVLRVELMQPGTVHWSDDDWATPREAPTADTGLGIHVADLPTTTLAPGGSIVFTWRDAASGAWTGTDHRLVVTSGRPA